MSKTRIDAQIACHRKGTYEQRVTRSRMIAFDRLDAETMTDFINTRVMRESVDNRHRLRAYAGLSIAEFFQ